MVLLDPLVSPSSASIPIAAESPYITAPSRPMAIEKGRRVRLVYQGAFAAFLLSSPFFISLLLLSSVPLSPFLYFADSSSVGANSTYFPSYGNMRNSIFEAYLLAYVVGWICAHPNGFSYAYASQYTRRMFFSCAMLLRRVVA